MLKSINLKTVYDSSENSILNDLIIPLLSNSNEYIRGVGYFSSGWLKLVSRGLVELIENGGSAKFVISPTLSKDDLEAFKQGTDAQNNKLLYNKISKDLSIIEKELETNTLNCLSWLIADKFIEFKFAINRESSIGDYHDKVGIFKEDITRNFVAIHGSLNDTYKGSLNGEAFSVFKSWEVGQSEYAKQHLDRLMDLWNNKNSQFKVLSIPETIREQFINLRTTQVPPYKRNKNQKRTRNITKLKNPFTLKEYQNDAIENWRKNDYNGILEMATGTGKTITAIAASLEIYKKDKKIVTVIIVPFLHLIDQWDDNCKKFGYKPVLCSSKHLKWKQKVKGKIQSFKLDSISNIVIIISQHSAVSDDFLDIIKKIPEQNFMYIVDEAHYLGAPKLQNALFEQAKYRLGLSATPQRWMDEKGSNILMSYYNGICYTYSLEKAIKNKFLTKYFYYPILVKLTENEMLEYGEFCEKIRKISVKKEKTNEEDKILEILLIQRANIIKSAKNKLPSFINQIQSLIDEADQVIKDILLFCAPGTHENILKQVSELNLKCHEFVHKVSAKERQVVLRNFANGDIQVLVTIKCMDEGVDVPSTKTAFFMASTTNPKEFIQRRGRILRKFDKKEFATIFDFLIIPPENYVQPKVVSSILQREMPRFTEFSDLAENKYEARQVIVPVLEKYGLTNLLDYKPWEIYNNSEEGVLNYD